MGLFYLGSPRTMITTTSKSEVFAISCGRNNGSGLSAGQKAKRLQRRGRQSTVFSQCQANERQ